MGCRMANIFLTSRDFQGSKVKVEPYTFRSQISQERYEIEKKCQWKSCTGFRMAKLYLTSRDD